MVKRQRFTAEFKREAVRLLDAGERPASEVTINLGIRRNQLYKWKTELVRSGEVAFPGSGRKGDQDSEIVRLKRELARAAEERGKSKALVSPNIFPSDPNRALDTSASRACRSEPA